MAGTTALPRSLLPRRRRTAADLHSCPSRVRVNPSLMANPAPSKKLKRPMPMHNDGSQPPPAKRVRGACSGGELHVAAATKIDSNSLPCPTSGNNQKSSTRLVASLMAYPEPATLQESAPESKPPMRKLIENAHLAKAAADEARHQRDIERIRAEARRKVEEMVDTVQFNDPFIDPSDVTKSPQMLLQSRQEAWCAQAQLIQKARQRAMEMYNRSMMH